MNETTVIQKLKDYANILNALYEAKIIRTYNSPVGDYAEWFISTKLNLILQDNSKKGYDAINPLTNEKFQIKSRWNHPKKNNRQLGVIRNYNSKEFDYLIAVVFGVNFEIKEVYLIPHDTIGKHFKYNKHQNGYIVRLTKTFLNDPTVKDIAHKLK